MNSRILPRQGQDGEPGDRGQPGEPPYGAPQEPQRPLTVIKGKKGLLYICFFFIIATLI